MLASVNFIPDTIRARSKLLKAGRNIHEESKEKKLIKFEFKFKMLGVGTFWYSHIFANARATRRV